MECEIIVGPAILGLYGVRILFSWEDLQDNAVILSFFRKIKKDMESSISLINANRIEFVLTETMESIKTKINSIAKENLISLNWN